MTTTAETDAQRARRERRRAQRAVYRAERRARGDVFDMDGVQMGADHWQAQVAFHMKKLAATVGYGKTRRMLLKRAEAVKGCAQFIEVCECQACDAEPTARLMTSCGLRICPWCDRAWANEARAAMLIVCTELLEAEGRDPSMTLRMLTFGHPYNPTDREEFDPMRIRVRLARLKQAVRAVWYEALAPYAKGAYFALETAAGGLTHAHVLWWGHFVDCTPTSTALAVAQRYIPGLKPQGFEATYFGPAVDGEGSPRGTLTDAVFEGIKYPLKGPMYTAVEQDRGWFAHPRLAAACEVAYAGMKVRGGYGDLYRVRSVAEALRDSEAAAAGKCRSCGSEELKTTRHRRADALRGELAPLTGVVRSILSGVGPITKARRDDG